jgi:hypothetical protein
MNSVATRRDLFQQRMKQAVLAVFCKYFGNVAYQNSFDLFFSVSVWI